MDNQLLPIPISIISGRALSIKASGEDSKDLSIIDHASSTDVARLYQTTAVGEGGVLELMLSDGTNKVFISSVSSAPTYFNGGNVGIGTTTPEVALDVEAGPGIVVRLSDGDPSHALEFYGDSHVGCVTKPCPLQGQSGWMKIRTQGTDSFVPLFN